MIIPGFSEEKILEELIYDKGVVSKEAKKLAKKHILRLQKTGRDGKDEDFCYTIDLTTAVNHNRWLVLVMINMSQNPKWFHRAVCLVESEHGTRDYYIVRGFSNNQPYYIKFSSHVLKRFQERMIKEKMRSTIHFDTDWLPTMVIMKGEVIPWMKITDPRLLQTVLDSEDRHEIDTLFYTINGCYIGHETPSRNVEFKTFLNNHRNYKKNEENIALYMCELAHAAFNKKLYPKKYLDNLFTDDYTIPDIIGDVMMKYKDNYKLLP